MISNKNKYKRKTLQQLTFDMCEKPEVWTQGSGLKSMI